MDVMEPPVPAIPARMASLPIHGGLAVPWITPRTDDGRWLFGSVWRHRLDQCLLQWLCGVCGERHAERMVLLMRLSDLAARCSAEPPLHPECAHYTIRACPMVAGRLRHHRQSPARLDDTMVGASDAALRRGAPAEPWFAVWLDDYRVVTFHGHNAASYAHVEPLRVRPVFWGNDVLFR